MNAFCFHDLTPYLISVQKIRVITIDCNTDVLTKDLLKEKQVTGVYGWILR